MRVCVFGLVAASVIMATPVRAQVTPQGLPAQVTLDDVLKLLEERSPQTVAGRASIAVAAADRITAATLPNPTISYGGVHLAAGLSTGAVTQNQFLIEQPLLFLHQRQARLQVANANVDAEEARVADALASRRLSVRSTFASLLSRQEQLRLLQQALDNMEHVQQLVRGKAAAGDRSKYDVARVEVETESVRVETLSAAADVEDLAGQLAVLLGFPGWSPRAMGTLEVRENLPTGVEELWATANERRPSLIALRRQQVAARGGVFLAQRERLPVPAISGGLQTTREVTGTSALFGVSVPLPFFDRNQGAIAKATAQMTAADLELQAAQAEVRAQIENSALVLAKRKEALRTFEGAVTDRVPALRRMAEDAYREGSADILELLDANRSLRDLQVERVQQLEAVKLAEETLISAASLDLGPTPR
ncbi:MAG TPA: TolC family protein [Vicinamibacterales bacterium]